MATCNEMVIDQQVSNGANTVLRPCKIRKINADGYCSLHSPAKQLERRKDEEKQVQRRRHQKELCDEEQFVGHFLRVTNPNVFQERLREARSAHKYAQAILPDTEEQRHLAKLFGIANHLAQPNI